MDLKRKVSRLVAAALATAGCLHAPLPARSAEAVELPPGALACKTVEHAAEHAQIVIKSPMAGLSDRLRGFVEPRVASGDCLQIAAETPASVTAVDQRDVGFVLVEISGQSGAWWTQAENVWGYFDAPKKLKSWGGK